jgi:recombinational DNA repair protein RecT
MQAGRLGDQLHVNIGKEIAMQTQQSRNGNGQPPRGVQGRPDIKAQEKVGEARVIEIFADNKVQIMGLLATDGNAEAGFLRAQALAVAAYRKAQADSEHKIDEQSMVATCVWSLRQNLDIGTEVWPVPYKGKITPIIAPDGMMKLIYNTGMVTAVNFSAVFKGDEFEHVLGTVNKIEHRKTGPRPRAVMRNGRVEQNTDLWNALTGAWCVIDLKGGGQVSVYFNKSELEYFRSLSPFGESASSPWAKYGDAMAEVRAMKRAAKRCPKNHQLSQILLSSEDSDGVEIPEDVWKAVGAKMLNEMTGETGAPAGNAESSPETQHSKRQIVFKPGDAKKLCIPGKAPQPTIYESNDEVLQNWEAKMRADFDAKKWNEQWFERNATQLATIRFELRDRGVAVPAHPAFDEPQAPAVQEPPQTPGVEQVQEQDPGYGEQKHMRQPGED